MVRKRQEGLCEHVAGEYHTDVVSADNCVVDDSAGGNRSEGPLTGERWCQGVRKSAVHDKKAVFVE